MNRIFPKTNPSFCRIVSVLEEYRERVIFFEYFLEDTPPAFAVVMEDFHDIDSVLSNIAEHNLNFDFHCCWSKSPTHNDGRGWDSWYFAWDPLSEPK